MVLKFLIIDVEMSLTGSAGESVTKKLLSSVDLLVDPSDSKSSRASS